MVAQTGCDAVMIGRAAPANPWIFRQIAQYTATGHYDVASDEDRHRMIRAYFNMLLHELAEHPCQPPATPGVELYRRTETRRPHPRVRPPRNHR